MKPKLLIATTNRGKILEFRRLLGDHFTCLAPGEGELGAIAPPEVVEDGATYRENAFKKAAAFFRTYGVAVLADDSGLEIDCLGGEPGLFSARYGGEELTWPQRWQYVYDRLKSHPRETWTARFRAVLCYFDGVGPPRFFEGLCEGRIHSQPVGGGGFGYDPIIYVDALGRTFGEATEEEKNRVSHRAQATRAFLNTALRPA